jgi:hypothetical protein
MFRAGGGRGLMSEGFSATEINRCVFEGVE